VVSLVPDDLPQPNAQFGKGAQLSVQGVLGVQRQRA
jgi:hypothetical protein